MAALQCEICGGKLVAKAGGLFECEYCGMQYDKSRIQEMVQEIKGTVKVEGTVEVVGTVKVDGQVQVEGTTSKENLLKLAKMKLQNADYGNSAWKGKESDYNKISSLLEQVLKIDAEYAEAYLYLAVLGTCSHNVEEFRTRYAEKQYVSKNFETFRQLATGDLAVLAQEIQAEFEAEADRQEAEKQRLEQEEQLAQQRETECFLKNRDLVRHQNALARRLIAVVGHISWEAVAGLQPDGTVRIINKYRDQKWKEAEKWRNIIAIAGGREELVGLTNDGCCYLCTETQSIPIYKKKDAIAISVGKDFVAILKSDGGIYIHGDEQVRYRCEFWSDLVSIETSGSASNLIAVDEDGNVDVAFSMRNSSLDVYHWKDVVSVGISYAGEDFYALLKDGTICEDRESNCRIYNESQKYYMMKDWEHIAAFQCVGNLCIGWKTDGSVVCKGFGSKKLENVIALCDNDCRIIGVTRDGSGCILSNFSEEPSWFTGVTDQELNETISKWNLFSSIDTLEQERELAIKQWADQEQQEANKRRKHQLSEEEKNLRTELSNLKGLFIGKRRREIEVRLQEIETELKELQ